MGLVQLMDLRWYEIRQSPFRYLGIRQHDGMPIDHAKWTEGKWSEKIDFDFND